MTPRRQTVRGGLFSVAGKVAVVTGGTSGIGRMIATGMVESGATVYVVARSVDDCWHVASELSHYGECFACPMDLSTEAGAKLLAAELLSSEAQVDVLVNCAGTVHSEALDRFLDADLDCEWNVNAKAIFHVTRHLLPGLRRAGCGDDPARVINVTSITGEMVPRVTADARDVVRDVWGYAATKAAANMLTRHLAHYLAPDNITVNAIAPGSFDSRLTTETLGDPTIRKLYEQRIPLGRIGRPSDVVGACIFLASRAGSYLTGVILPVDGGWSTAN